MGGHHHLSKAEASECPNSPRAWASISGACPTPRTLTHAYLRAHTPLCWEVSSGSISIHLNQGVLPSRFITSPGSLPRCPMDVPSQPCICIFPPYAMVVGGWDCAGERPVWQGPLGFTGGPRSRHNLGPFLGMLHVHMPVHLCVCVGGPCSSAPSLPLTLVILRKATLCQPSYELHTWGN